MNYLIVRACIRLRFLFFIRFGLYFITLLCFICKCFFPNPTFSNLSDLIIWSIMFVLFGLLFRNPFYSYLCFFCLVYCYVVCFFCIFFLSIVWPLCPLFLIQEVISCFFLNSICELQVLVIQANGGQRIASGDRNKSGGGVLWKLLKARDPDVYKEIMTKGREFEVYIVALLYCTFLLCPIEVNLLLLKYWFSCIFLENEVNKFQFLL